MKINKTVIVLAKSLTSTILTTHQPRMHRTLARNPVHQHGNNLGGRANKIKARPPTIHSDQPRVPVFINENYCVPQWGIVVRAKRTETLVDNCQTLNVNYFTVNYVPFVA